jgi:hypothetical protein
VDSQQPENTNVMVGRPSPHDFATRAMMIGNFIQE